MVCDGQGYALLGGDVGDGHHALGHMGNSQRNVLLAASGSVHAIEVDGGAVQVEVAPGSTGSFRDKLARRRRARVFRDRGCAKRGLACVDKQMCNLIPNKYRIKIL